ncbi:hypothetical protein LTR62_004611 [Meristemomyces frigidus]|uniref:Protein kinase domain-containing protein n=1 Tax=Meristemomyces frigidus TaxID=1508187 RepID=A0AAN7YJT5_9PEZI|nr:hypothetical protein LTR62_004611 [Meristemomyces frigidus]
MAARPSTVQGSGIFVQSGVITDDSTILEVTRGPSTFIITVHFADIEHTSWGQDYLRSIGKLPSLKNLEKLSWSECHDLVLTKCLPITLELSPISSIQGQPLEVLCSAPTYRLQLLANNNGEGDGVLVQIHGDVTYEPSHNLLPMPVSELPASCNAITRIPASSITLATVEGETDPRAMDNPQGKVYLSDGRPMYYKPERGHGIAFKRELDILGRIDQFRLHHDGSSRLSCLEAIVTTGVYDEFAVGMLLHLIPCSTSGGDFLAKRVRARVEMHGRWKAQVVAMVEVLHDHDLVWGDVNAGNVVIDDSDNAWIIDLGGSNNPEFVDDQLRETKEGDWQGVRRLFDQWLPKNRSLTNEEMWRS